MRSSCKNVSNAKYKGKTFAYSHVSGFNVTSAFYVEFSKIFQLLSSVNESVLLFKVLAADNRML